MLCMHPLLNKNTDFEIFILFHSETTRHKNICHSDFRDLCYFPIECCTRITFILIAHNMMLRSTWRKIFTWTPVRLAYQILYQKYVLFIYSKMMKEDVYKTQHWFFLYELTYIFKVRELHAVKNSKLSRKLNICIHSYFCRSHRAIFLSAFDYFSKALIPKSWEYITPR